MSAQHTPGPWRVAEPTGFIYAANPYIGHDMLVAQVRGWGHLTGTGGGGCAFDEDKAIAIQEANARLIAAAPDLLAALKEAENALADYIPTIEKTGASLNYGHKVLARCRAAIAKAEGR